MKFLTLTVWSLVIATIAISSVKCRSVSLSGRLFSQGMDKYVARVFLAKTISERVIARLEKQLRDLSVPQNPKGTLIPPMDDPACIAPMVVGINITIPNMPATIKGNFALTSPASVTGFSKIVDDFNLNLANGGVGIKWDFSLPTEKIEGEYNIEVILDIDGNNTDILGSGNLLASVDEVFLQMDAIINLPIVGKVGLRTLTMDVGFSNLAIDAEAASINGALIDWPSKSEELEAYFDTIWNEETRPIITEMIRCSVDHVINDCTTAQIINSTLVCLKFEINEECYDGQIPPTVSLGENVIPWTNFCSASTDPTESTITTLPSSTTLYTTTELPSSEPAPISHWYNASGSVLIAFNFSMNVFDA